MPGFGARLRNWFHWLRRPETEAESQLGPESKTGPARQASSPSPDRIDRRIRRVAQSILDNERLTADLDDPAAQELLDWGLSIARRIAQGTADVEDDEQAEQAMYPRLHATRRLMRAVNRWIASQREKDAEGQEEALDTILEQASVIYGRPITALTDEQRVSFGVQPEQAGDPPGRIAHLRQLIERPDDIPDH
jgi:hypothetical protein